MRRKGFSALITCLGFLYGLLAPGDFGGGGGIARAGFVYKKDGKTLFDGHTLGDGTNGEKNKKDTKETRDILIAEIKKRGVDLTEAQAQTVVNESRQKVAQAIDLVKEQNAGYGNGLKKILEANKINLDFGLLKEGILSQRQPDGKAGITAADTINLSPQLIVAPPGQNAPPTHHPITYNLVNTLFTEAVLADADLSIIIHPFDPDISNARVQLKMTQVGIAQTTAAIGMADQVIAAMDNPAGATGYAKKAADSIQALPAGDRPAARTALKKAAQGLKKEATDARESQKKRKELYEKYLNGDITSDDLNKGLNKIEKGDGQTSIRLPEDYRFVWISTSVPGRVEQVVDGEEFPISTFFANVLDVAVVENWEGLGQEVLLVSGTTSSGQGGVLAYLSSGMEAGIFDPSSAFVVVPPSSQLRTNLQIARWFEETSPETPDITHLSIYDEEFSRVLALEPEGLGADLSSGLAIPNAFVRLYWTGSGELHGSRCAYPVPHQGTEYDYPQPVLVLTDTDGDGRLDQEALTDFSELLGISEPLVTGEKDQPLHVGDETVIVQGSKDSVILVATIDDKGEVVEELASAKAPSLATFSLKLKRPLAGGEWIQAFDVTAPQSIHRGVTQQVMP